VRAPAFSPDGRRLAFENIRGGYPTGPWRGVPSFNWSYIAVHALGSDTIAYVDPALASDSAPSWEGPGRISFHRRIGDQPGARITRSLAPRIATATPADAPNLALLGSLLSIPTVYQPVRSWDGRALAFVGREGRSRSVYFAGAGGQARPVVRYDGDDGLELSQLALSIDGRWLAYVRGGSPNDKGETPNPRSLVTPPVQQLWIVKTGGGASPQLIGQGSQPQFSPDGGKLLWQTASGVASASFEGETGRGPTEYLMAGPAKRLRFSPDGTRIAYERSSHVEILDLRTGVQRALEKPSTAKDSYPSWSRDGRHLAFVRTFGDTPPTGTVARPWELVVTDSADYRPRTIWRAEAGVGSAFYALDQDQTQNGVEGEQLLWAANGEIAFAWEKDGWRHLYAVPSAGGSARLLTPGDGEVEAAALSLDGGSILYSTNIGDLSARRLWSVPFTGGSPKRFSGTSRNQWGATPLAEGGVAMVEAGHDVPPMIVIGNVTGKSRRVGGPKVAGDHSKKMVLPQAVSFTSPDGQTAYGELFVPKQPTGCGIIFIHGGSRRQMLRGFHYLDAYTNLYELNQYLTMRGCAVLSVEYRSGIMLGHAFRNPPKRGDAGASEYQDVLGGLAYLRSRPDLKVSKVGIYGLSYGGLLTAQALARDSDKFAVGFDMAGLHTYLGEGFKHSPAAFVEKWTSPVYFASGDDDRNVDHSQSILLHNEIIKRRPDLEVVGEALPNEVHDLYLTMDDLVRVYWNGSQFMLKYLSPASSH
jgi:dipeptidyl aminopeptidase/acylaminoacyl peptidase